MRTLSSISEPTSTQSGSSSYYLRFDHHGGNPRFPVPFRSKVCSQESKDAVNDCLWLCYLIPYLQLSFEKLCRNLHPYYNYLFQGDCDGAVHWGEPFQPIGRPGKQLWAWWGAIFWSEELICEAIVWCKILQDEFLLVLSHLSAGMNHLR